MYHTIGLAIFITLSYFAFAAKHPLKLRSNYFKNGKGHPIPVVHQDTRFRRFTNGKEVSDEGSRRFGNSPYLVKNGKHHEVVISQPSHVKEFFSQDGSDHQKLHDCNMGSFFARSLGSCVGVQNGTKWRTTRSHLETHFSFSSAASMVEDTRRTIEQWAQNLPEDTEIGQKMSQGFQIDAVTACRQLPFRLIAMALYGPMFSEPMFARLWGLNSLHEQMTYVTFLSRWAATRLYRWFPTKANATLKNFEEQFKEFNLELIERGRKAGVAFPVESMYQAVEEGKVDMTSFLQSIDEILFTNIDVTSSMFAYCLINLGRQLGIQNSLRKEVREKPCTSDVFRYIQDENTLLHQVYLEILRNSPPAWFSLPELTAKDKTIGGYLIPAATPVIIDVRRLNQESPVWAPDGTAFRPDRWSSISKVDARYSLYGYGLGPRKCLGKNFALMMIKLLIITVLEQYHLGAGVETKIRRDTWTCTPDSLVSFEKLV
ncbi:cytochrome P450 [Aspergillus avenaceus]|uniref:Cytochrome P450 n=1 Tax=Aspergillus avenaceus TaxID=36643 RepID=A0A5N6U4X3_ASPAV|nr:cytochrome P450 [Aspergillus avenaceus]